MALGSLLGEVGEVVSVIDGREVGPYSMTRIAWNGRKPQRLYAWLDRSNNPLVAQGRERLRRKLNAGDDFVSEDPDASVDRFLKIHSRFGVLQALMEAVEPADALVINGEGDYIFTTPPRRNFLFYNFLLRLAQRLGKATYVVNAMFSDCPSTGRNEAALKTSLEVLARCKRITVRDQASLAYLKAHVDWPHLHFVPDALFTWSAHVPGWTTSIRGALERFQGFGEEMYKPLPSLNFDEPYLALSGSSLAAWNPGEARERYSVLAQRLGELGLPVLVVPTCNGDTFLQEMARELELPLWPREAPIRLGAGVLGKAAVFVSGRFHPAILASDGGTPCVFLGSNSHKTLSLQHMLEYPEPLEFNAIPTDADIEGIVELTRQKLESGARETIQATATRRGGEARQLVELLKPQTQPASAEANTV